MTIENNGSTFQEKFESQHQAILDAQKQSLKIIAETASFLDNSLKNEAEYKVSMRDIINNLIKNGYAVNDAKALTQHNYLLLDLAKARRNRYISIESINLRIAYIQDRLKSMFRIELHNQILDLIKTNNTLFAWNTSYINSQKNYPSQPK